MYLGKNILVRKDQMLGNGLINDIFMLKQLTTIINYIQFFKQNSLNHLFRLCTAVKGTASYSKILNETASIWRQIHEKQSYR